MKFTTSHEWVNIEGDVVTVGITDYAQKELGDIVFVELPRVGDRVKKSCQFGTIESTKAASELYSPVTGEVVEVNEALVANPQWINESPYEKGWMVRIRIVNTDEVDALLDEIEYREFVSKERR